MDTLGKRTNILIENMTQVFKDGYRPARGNQTYNYILKNDVKLYSMVNCFGHVFNLRNEQFDDYHFEAFPLFGNFKGMFYEPQDKAAQNMLEFIRAVGLKVEECDPRKPIEDFKSWKATVYFEDHPIKRDFHWLLEEKTGLWSSKIGFEACLENIQQITPPKSYRNLVDTDEPTIYNYYATYKITNPNANANNRYLKNFNFSTNGFKITTSQKHYVIEDTRENSFDKMLENLCTARGLL